MGRTIGELINECIRLQDEISLSTPILFALSPSLNMEKMLSQGISKTSGNKMKEKVERSLGLEKVKAEYARRLRDINLTLLELAERLEEVGFEIEKLRPQLSEGQHVW
jgi:hypothetical protein